MLKKEDSTGQKKKNHKKGEINMYVGNSDIPK